ncbi:MAG: MFS transporter [Firmicutes bacterium]|nr:MFS transporter [Alicyclobacillaceae bacterium]MCL6497649.1 MFS transporter [Bacillota bacterium]
MGVYLVGVFIGALDNNVVGPVFPLLMRGFGVSLAWVGWTVSAYTVAYVASTVLAGAMGDRWGHQRLFRWGVTAFGAASLLAALSRVYWLFIVARLIQGAGAGAVYPNAQAEALRHFPREKQGTALGLFGAVFGLAAILGPVVGGALGQYLGWPAVFWVNVPVVLVTLALARRLPPARVEIRPLPDLAGGLAFSGLIAGALLAFMDSGAARWAWLGAAVVLAAGFVWRQRRALEPFLETAPLANGAGVALMVGAALIGFDMASAVFVPTLGQRELGFTVLQSGLSLLPAALSGAVLSGVGGVLVDRLGPRPVLVVGLLAAAVGGVLLAAPHLDTGRFLLAMAVMGMGTAFTMGAPLNRIGVALFREDQAGQALALMALFRSVGLAAGPVLLTLAAAGRGFSGMFGAVAAASAVGAVLFAAVPMGGGDRSQGRRGEGPAALG